MKNLRIAMVVAALASLAAPASAAEYLLDFAGARSSGGTGTLFATLRIATSDTANALGGFDVYSVDGVVDGEDVLGIIANPNAPGTIESNNFLFDNILFDANPAFDIYGLAFTTATGSWNLWGESADVYTLLKNTPGFGYTGARIGTLAVTAVPEPASWAMLIAGFGLVGAVARRRAALTA
jgi:hypothetical protein